MSALAEFSTIPQMYSRVSSRYAGQSRDVLRYKDKKSKKWVGITWDELTEQIHAMVGYLHKQGVRFGDRVAILAENRPEWTITDLATQMLGAVNVSLYTSLPPAQVEYIIKDSGSKVFVVSTGIQLKKAEKIFDNCPDLERVVTMSEMRREHGAHVQSWDDAMAEGAAHWKEHRAEIEPLLGTANEDDLSALIYTSGTTGNPKGVMLTHKNFCSNANSALRFVPFSNDDEHLSFLPLCHSFERTAGYTCVLAAGATITYAESVDTVSKNLPEVRPTLMISVPRVFERVYNIINKSVEEGSPTKQKIFRWAVSTGHKVAAAKAKGKQPNPIVKAQYGLATKLVFGKIHEKLGGRVRFAVSGGAALPKAIGEFFMAAGVTIIEGYGLTETAPVLAANPVHAPRFGTVGHVLPGIEVAIMRVDDGKILGTVHGDSYPNNLSTEEGEIVAKGPNIMRGYWNNDSATREAIDADGWYHTGDVGRFEDGYLRITDRIKHMIVNRGGKNIYPGPIEEQFKTVTWVDQINIIGEGQPYLTALVVPDFDALKHYARTNGLIHNAVSAMLAQDEIKALFDKEFRAYSRKAAAHEKIRGFRLLEEAFTVENNMMTPTLKLKRKEIEKTYAHLIEEMYEGVL